MDKAATGGGDAANAFKAMGISVTNSEGGLKPLDTIIDEISNKFQGFADGPAKAALAVAIFGRAGAQLIPLLDEGGAAIDKMKAEAVAFGVTFNGPAAEAAEQFNDNLKRMGDAGAGLWQTFVGRLIPAFSDLFNQIANILGDSQPLKDAITAVGVAFGVVVLAVDAVALGLRELIDLIGIFYHAFADPLQAIGTLIGDLLTGNIKKLGTDFSAVGDTMKAHIIGDINDISAAWKSFQDASKKVFGLTGLDDNEGDKPQAPVIPDSGTDPNKAKQEEYDDGLAMMKENLQAETTAMRQADIEQINDAKSTSSSQLAIKQQDFQQAVQLSQLSADQQKQQAEQLAQEEYNIDLRAMQDEYNLATTSEQRKSQLRQQELQAYQKFQEDLHKIDLQAQAQKTAAEQKSAQQQEQIWRSILSPFRSTFQEMTNGVLQGTQTWKEAWANAGTNMVTAMANAGEQILENLIINTAEGLAVQKSANSQKIMGDAKAAFTGAYNSASSIPYVGWILGPIAGAAAFAACMAMSYDVGTGSVPSDMAANIHKGEIIIPRTFSDGLRTGQLTLGGPAASSGGGGDFHMHGDINVMHGGSKPLTPRDLMKMLAVGARDNPGLKLA